MLAQLPGSEHALVRHDLRRRQDQALALHRALVGYNALQANAQLAGKAAPKSDVVPRLAPDDYSLTKCRWALAIISTRSFSTAGPLVSVHADTHAVSFSVERVCPLFSLQSISPLFSQTFLHLTAPRALISLSLSLSLARALSLSRALSFSLSLALSLALSLSLLLSLFLALSLSLSLSRSRSLSLSLSLSISLSLALALALSLSFPRAPSLLQARADEVLGVPVHTLVPVMDLLNHDDAAHRVTSSFRALIQLRNSTS